MAFNLIRALVLGGLAGLLSGCGPRVPSSSSMGIPDTAPPQPVMGSRVVPMLERHGQRFRDLNRNGTLDPYEDWRRPVDERISDLLSQMTLEEKAGLLVHPMLRGYSGPNGEVLTTRSTASTFRVPDVPYLRAVEPLDEAPPALLVTERHVRWVLLPAITEPPERTARFSNGLQELAERARLGIPMVLSSDPRHTRASWHPKDPSPPHISRWPNALGFAALRDPSEVTAFATMAAHEYRALGLHVALSPSADLATEPRWNRIESTFGEDESLVEALVFAYVRGFQGERLSASSVATMTKHFPGNGPMKGGWDSHNHYGKLQVYPGGRLADHIRPFSAAIRAGTAGIMPGYGIPDGVDTVGMGMSRTIVTERLRDGLRFDGLVVTDWLRYMPWGVESLSQREIQKKIVEAGCDQLGDNNEPKTLVSLVREGAIREARVDQSARRVLRVMFGLGLFENPYVEEATARREVGRPDFVAKGRKVQSESVVLLRNEGDHLPLAGKLRIFLENVSREDATAYGVVVEKIEDADVAVVKIDTPYVTRKDGTSYFRISREGPLSYLGADNESELVTVKRLIASGKPVIVAVHLERPGILTELVEGPDLPRALLGHFGSSDAALLDVVFGREKPRGKLPFDLPRDAASVERQREDVPFDLERPLFSFGFGLSFRR